ncbi:hypothetical protein [Pseudonocardia sp. GCM10023141]|uniref:hypothetical protein n=1 Tax=Pseudonocardia sp. GCM10023141 TaxID=3252653 RepID=UPI0036081DF7
MTQVAGSPMIARARWRAAEDRLYPTLLADPTAYQRGLAAIQAVVEELRRRDVDVAGLMAFETAPDEVLEVACPGGVAVPVDLLVAVACGMRDREITAAATARRREEAVQAARTAGADWAVLDGPADVAQLAGGRRVAVHLATGIVVEASIDEWAREDQFVVTVMPGESRSFDDREAWLSAIKEIEAATAAGGGAPRGATADPS